MNFEQLKPGMEIKYSRRNSGLGSKPIRTDENEEANFCGQGIVAEVYPFHFLIRKGIRKFSISKADMICGCAKVVIA